MGASRRRTSDRRLGLPVSRLVDTQRSSMATSSTRARPCAAPKRRKRGCAPVAADRQGLHLLVGVHAGHSPRVPRSGAAVIRDACRAIGAGRMKHAFPAVRRSNMRHGQGRCSFPGKGRVARRTRHTCIAKKDRNDVGGLTRRGPETAGGRVIIAHLYHRSGNFSPARSCNPIERAHDVAEALLVQGSLRAPSRSTRRRSKDAARGPSSRARTFVTRYEHMVFAFLSRARTPDRSGRPPQEVFLRVVARSPPSTARAGTPSSSGS